MFGGKRVVKRTPFAEITKHADNNFSADSEFLISAINKNYMKNLNIQLCCDKCYYSNLFHSVE